MKKSISLSTYLPKAFLGLSFLLILISCRPEPLLISVPQLESKIVVSSQVVPPNVLLISLSQSFSALQSVEDDSTGDILNQIILKNAAVSLNYAGREDSLLEIDNGFYIGLDIEAIVGSTYQLKVTDSIGRSVSAQTILLPEVEFDSIRPLVERLPEDTIVRIQYSLIDQAGPNWYMLNYYSNVSNDDSSFTVSNILGQGNPDGYLGTDLISDQEFAPDGTFRNERVFFNLDADSSVVAISIANISEEYYNYLVLRERAGNIFSQIVSEPINYPTNVEGGLGFFTLHYPSFRFFAISDY